MNFKKENKFDFSRLTDLCKRFSTFLTYRIRNDMIFRVAASLSYTSLIAIVPLIAVMLSIFSAFPAFDNVKDIVQQTIIENIVPSSEAHVVQYFNEFIQSSAKLTAIGAVGVAITAIMLLSTIENSLNFIFKAKRARRITAKITLYWTIITLGPLLMGAAISIRGYFYTLQKFMPDSVNDFLLLGKVLPSLLTLTILVVVYLLVPNKKIKFTNAIAGALVAVFIFSFLRGGFAWFMSQNATYSTLYGALAIIPVSLIWMYLSWSVVIFGAVITASLEEFQQLDGKTINKILRKDKLEKRK